ncbi:hypothetical protein JJB74_14845 [Noviherbaspirillum sp. DKR-6]|uniref:Outer membrane protein domain-containing protein n=1 Tax=Noviherbaspirillum pedocola TaxID=2801341 RepID=A0A934W735_9BURK|nr:hypothetical protein [Noviherbaspirillum pedocola]
MPLRPDLNVRFGVNTLSHSFSGSASNVNYDFDAKLQTFDALLDWFPRAGSFRISGGLIYNGNHIDATARPDASASYTFNGVTYTSSDIGSANGRIDFRKFAPYLGIGWGNAAAKNKGWGFTADLGLMFQGSASVSFNAVCGPTADATPGGCAALQENVAAEQANLANKMDGYTVYPVARLGVTYRF